ncbi:hypothetical protein FQR65_LT18972 [Abscondita terminalis]|nr:hypothetical protein FQR65_LT18972 [Abscondita terminalis]
MVSQIQNQMKIITSIQEKIRVLEEDAGVIMQQNRALSFENAEIKYRLDILEQRMIQLNSEKDIETAFCTCPRGQFVCHHISALWIHGHHNISITEVECKWSSRKVKGEKQTVTVQDLYKGKPLQTTGSTSSTPLSFSSNCEAATTHSLSSQTVNVTRTDMPSPSCSNNAFTVESPFGEVVLNTLVGIQEQNKEILKYLRNIYQGTKTVQKLPELPVQLPITTESDLDTLETYLTTNKENVLHLVNTTNLDKSRGVRDGFSKTNFYETMDIVMTKMTGRFSSNTELIGAISDAEVLDVDNIQYLSTFGITLPSKEEMTVVKSYLAKLHNADLFTEVYK